MDSPEDTVRRQWEAWTRLDIDALAEFWHEDLVWDNTRSARVPGVIEGRSEILAFLAVYMAGWEGYRLEATSFESAGNRVLGLVTHTGVRPGEGGDRPITEDWAIVFTVREGLITRIDVYFEQDAAKAALRQGR
jgi:ketosteroid isomerase-like protein